MPSRDTTDQYNAEVAPVTIAADLLTPVCVADNPGVVTGVSYIARAAIAGAASPNSRTITLFNGGPTGAGVVVCARLAMVAAGATSIIAMEAKPIPLGTLADRTIAKGDILYWSSIAVTGAGGLVDPGGTVEVVVTPSLS